MSSLLIMMNIIDASLHIITWNAYSLENYELICIIQGYGKTISHVVIGLKTAKGTKQLKLDPTIYEGLQKEKVETGDVIYIEANSGAVKVISIF